VQEDAITIVEAAYDLEHDERHWLTNLLESARHRLDRGMGVSGWEYELGAGITHQSRVWIGVNDRVREAWTGVSKIDGGQVSRRIHAAGGQFVTAMQNLGLTEEEARRFPPMVTHLQPLGVYDMLAVTACDPTGHGVVLAAPMPDVRRPRPRERRPWARIATHIEAGARLRRALVGGALGNIEVGAEAVLSADGAVQHAEAPAKSVDARTELRRAARAIDRARTRARSDEDEALDLWQGLVAGRWSLVERFDSDGRRFLVARRNDPRVKDPRALTLRERQVLAYAAMGHRLKLIGYALGLSVSAVSGHRKSAMRKLGLRSQADLVALFASAPSDESR
jgi:DNA-binding CsgD family transcriptional regulator